ncbi:GntR family transcriptional regulator [Rubrimonas sp.]|uniref:GntR family transcriptional regulator n=1 Tax=Rubrimonas sp. TaxID=2036015 RepID=UPI002FDD4371
MDELSLHITNQPPTLRRMVEDRLRAAILQGRFKPGQRLIERELCELIGVSRTSIREALRHLEAEGIVDTVSQRGPVVARMSLDEAMQLYQLRAALEAFAARQFALNASATDIRLLKDALQQIKECDPQDSGGALLQAKSNYYAVLMRGCGNIYIGQLLSNLHNRIMLLRKTTMSRPGRIKDSIAEMQEICDAVEARDPARAERAAILHIEAASAIAAETLRERALDQGC